MPVYIMRHCAKELDRKRFPVDDETPLSAAGCAQIPEVGAALRAAIDAHGHNGNCTLVSSDQLRSVQTRDGILPYLNGLKVTEGLDPRLREISRGSHYALTKEERHAIDPVGTSRNELLKNLHPHGMLIARADEGEDVYQIYSKRIHPFVNNLKKDHNPEDPIILITSNIPARLLTMDLARKSFGWYMNEPTPPFGSIRKIQGKSWDNMKDAGYVYGGPTVELTQVGRLSASQENQEKRGSFKA